MSELCQMHLETPIEHRGLPTHTKGYRCGEKCLMRCDLMRFEVSRYARPESISKRAPSTTRTSLRVFRIKHLRETEANQKRDCAPDCALTPVGVFGHFKWVQAITVDQFNAGRTIGPSGFGWRGRSRFRGISLSRSDLLLHVLRYFVIPCQTESSPNA